jgi:hypothetical protein
LIVVRFITGLCRLSPTNTILKLTTVSLFTLAIVTHGFAAPKNLVAGVGPLTSVTNWEGETAISVLSGASLFPTTSKTTAFYIAFTGGTAADISNMVLYQTDARDPKITAVTPITLNGASNPSINLTDTAVCPDQPVSETAPCIIELDKLTLQLATASDYYLEIYFTNPSSNNHNLSLAKPRFFGTSLTGFEVFKDDTKRVVGDTLDTLFISGSPLGLIAVMNK